MNNSALNAFNFATTFGLLLAIALGIWIYLLRKDVYLKSSKRKK